SPAAPKTNDTLTATATKSDGDADPVTLTYVWKVGGTTVRTTSGTTSLTDTLDLSQAGNGDHGDAVTVTVTPNDGIEDGTAVAFAAPTGGTYVNTATAALSATASDAGTGVASVEFFQCSDNSVACAAGTFTSIGVSGDAASPYGVTWTLPSDGRRALQVRATDAVGHVSTDVVSV